MIAPVRHRPYHPTRPRAHNTRARRTTRHNRNHRHCIRRPVATLPRRNLAARRVHTTHRAIRRTRSAAPRQPARTAAPCARLAIPHDAAAARPAPRRNYAHACSRRGRAHRARRSDIATIHRATYVAHIAAPLVRLYIQSARRRRRSFFFRRAIAIGLLHTAHDNTFGNDRGCDTTPARMPRCLVGSSKL